MTYKKSDFGKALLVAIDLGYSVEQLAHWAFVQHMDHCRELESGLEREMMTVIAMGEGPEFHISEIELRKLATQLLNS